MNNNENPLKVKSVTIRVAGDASLLAREVKSAQEVGLIVAPVPTSGYTSDGAWIMPGSGGGLITWD